MSSLTAIYKPNLHCTAVYLGKSTDTTVRYFGWGITLYEGLLGLKRNNEGWEYITDAPHELKVAAACLCAGLMPPSIFADLLEDHRPDLSEVAAFLREWERLKGEQK